ncbi:MAG: hypothetical protein KKB50_19995 [Planctomycetes bacterium]|nr:hypothetical protein [Planctomycetota bacterium]
MAGLPTYHGSILAEYTIDELELGGIGRLWAVTPNDWVNALAVQRFSRIFTRAECYQTAPQNEPHGKQTLHRHLQGRWLFGQEHTYAEIQRHYNAGATFKATPLSKSFDYAAFCARYGETAIPLGLIAESGRLSVYTAARVLEPVAGQTLISLVHEPSEQPEPADQADE